MPKERLLPNQVWSDEISFLIRHFRNENDRMCTFIFPFEPDHANSMQVPDTVIISNMNQLLTLMISKALRIVCVAEMLSGCDNDEKHGIQYLCAKQCCSFQLQEDSYPED